MPKVSIIVPCYNQAQYLDECLQSVLLQSFEEWECIIVNDGSPDNTESIALTWTAKDKRFKYLSKENGGLSSARNAGIELACGEFILPLDADDRIGVNYSSKAVKAFIDFSDLKVVYCKAEKFGEEQGTWNLAPFSRRDLIDYNMLFCSAFYRKTEWKRVGGYDESMVHGYEDWEFWIAILKNGGEVLCIDYVGFYYRIKKDSMFKQILADQKTSIEYKVKAKHIDFFISNYDELILLNKDLQNKVNQLEFNFKSEKVLINALFFKVLGFEVFRLKK